MMNLPCLKYLRELLALLCIAFLCTHTTAQDVIISPDGVPVSLPPGTNVSPEMLQQIQQRAGAAAPTPQAGKPSANPGKKDDKSAGKPDGKKKPEDEKPKGPPENVKRSSEPPEKPNPEELKVTPDNDGLLSFQFRNQPWLDVLAWYADACELSFDWQELPGDYINLATQRPHTLQETGDMINRALLMRGFTILENDETLLVAKIEGLNPSLVPRLRPDELPDLPPRKFVRNSFPLSWLLAEEVHSGFASMISKNGKL